MNLAVRDVKSKGAINHKSRYLKQTPKIDQPVKPNREKL